MPRKGGRTQAEAAADRASYVDPKPAPTKIVAIEPTFEGGVYTGALALGKLINRYLESGAIMPSHAQKAMQDYTNTVIELVEGRNVP